MTKILQNAMAVVTVFGVRRNPNAKSQRQWGAMMEAMNVDGLSRKTLTMLNEEVAKILAGDVVFINCGMFPPLDDDFRVAIEELKATKNKRPHLIVMLETDGGLMETVERLVVVMRKHYKTVSFVVPNYAYSAGTVLALSGDRIYMDYYSVLGPIDPQYQDSDGKYVPGYGVLEKYRELIEAINKTNAPDNTANDSDTVTAELHLLIQNFSPGEIFLLEQAIEHGKTLITEWLPKYKFKDWKKTATKGEKVTLKMKEDRAEQIAEILGDASEWHSHERGISMERLRGDKINLVIDDFSLDPDLNSAIKNYHGLAVDYFSKIGYEGYIHTRNGVRRIA